MNINAETLQEVKAILFDKDDTLIDSDKSWIPYYRLVFNELAIKSFKTLEQITLEFGFDMNSEELEDNCILHSGTPEQVISKWSLISQLEYSIVEKIAQKYYKKVNISIPMVENTKDIIKTLSERIIFMGITTMDHGDMAKRTAKELKISKWVCYFYGIDKYKPKPNSDMIESFSKDIGISCENIVLIGDSIDDIKMAVSVNAMAIGVSKDKIHTQKLLKSGANLVIPNISYLDKILLK